MANRRNRAFRITAVALTLTVSHLASVRPYVATCDEINNRHSTQGIGVAISAGTNGNKTYKVYEFKPHLPILGSSRLVPIASEDERHDPDVIWSTNAKLTEEIEAKVAESMRVRLKRRWDSGSASFDPSEYSDEQMKSTLHNMTQEELNSVDPNWNIFIQENTDGGMGGWPYWWMEHQLKPLCGYKRIHYATRSTQNDRFMDSWANALVQTGNSSLVFDPYLSRPLNFTEYIDEKMAFGSMHRLFLHVRDDITDAIDGYVTENHPGASDVASLPRATDVRTFWNSSVCNMHCDFRNRVSEIVRSMPERHSGIDANTDVVGFIHNKGRNAVHPDFIRGMLTTKIIVLAQRDRWEDHMRLYEALVSGAMVMSDPMTHWPHGLADGENIVVYHSWADLELKVLHYLSPANEEERVEIGRRGREAALRHQRPWQQAELLFLNDMSHRNPYGLFNKPRQGG